MATKPASTVLKAFGVLELFQHRASLSVSQCALLLKVPRATAHRLLVSLEAAGVVERDDGGHYQLGLRMFELGSLAPLRRLYSEQGRAPLQKLSADTGLPVHLAVREESSGILLEVIPGSRYNLPTRVGFPIPLHSTALGKLLLANADAEVLAKVLAGGLPRFTRNTIQSERRLAGELERIRGTGVSYDRQETHYGLVCVAVPIRVGGAGIRAAVSMSYPADVRRETAAAHHRELVLTRNRVEDSVSRARRPAREHLAVDVSA